MLSGAQWARALLTSFGLVGFGILAAGTGDSDSKAPPPPAPEVQGLANAMAWARSTSPDLAALVQDVESEKSHAQGEVYRLESLRAQFPQQADEISSSIDVWRKIIIELESAIDSSQEMISDAYVDVQSNGSDPRVALGQVLATWRGQADRALRTARAQRARVSSTP